MRLLALTLVLSALLVPTAAPAQFKGYFDVSHVQLPELQQPDWGRRQDGEQVRYLCVHAERCPSTSSSRDFARQLSDMATRSIVPQVFKAADNK
jgi:hypothetical protein